MAKENERREPELYSASDLAVIFDVTRQAVYKWEGASDGFTAEDIERLIEERQREIDRIKARWHTMRASRAD